MSATTAIRTATEYRTQALFWINENERKSPLLTVCACWLLAAKVQARDEEGFTAATDGVTVWLNTKWFSEMSVKDRAYVMCHEAMHGILRHMPQMRNLFGTDRIKSHIGKLSNIAMDAWINYTLSRIFAEDGGYYRPAFGGVHYDTTFKVDKKVVNLFSDHTLFNPDDCDWFWLYQRIHREAKSSGAGGGDDLEEGSGEAGDAEAETQASRAVAQAAARSQSLGTSNGGGWLERLLGTVTKPTHNWRQELWQAVPAAVPAEYSYRRLNKNYLNMGAAVGTISRPGLGAVGLFMDTSGSISEEMLAQPCAEASAIFTELRPERMYQLWVDAEVAHVQVYEAGDQLSPEPKGGGGTDFAPAFRWIEENVEEPLALAIYFTDLYADYSNLVEPDYPVIWFVFPGGNSQDPPFGKVIRMEG